ncbi:MAG: sulfatase-like hydrolase/transferase, partial [Akkermansiaceae bacterium]|nr:sulfatase-like hydrolase/transferase [Akkermansiaceae bacterium]
MEESSHFCLLAVLIRERSKGILPIKCTKRSSQPQSCGEIFPMTVNFPFFSDFRVRLMLPVINALASLMLVIPVVLLAAEPAKVPAKPNILFAVADDWSFGHAGAYGCKWISTPAMDRVAREGILFTQAYTPNAKCSPSRACIITGRNPWQLKEAGNHWSIFPPEFTSYQEALAEKGYFVGMTGKGWGPGIAKNVAGQNREMAGKPFEER